MVKMKLGLGTVQFGQDYGISNSQGRVSQEEISGILALAARHGVTVLDTAALYGTSEENLGLVLPKEHNFKIVTKTPKFSGEQTLEHNLNLLTEAMQNSLLKLKQQAVYGLMFHDADNLLSDHGKSLFTRMSEFKEQGLVQKIGVSVYNEEQIDRVLSQYPIDIIQLPINVLDQRLLTGGALAKLKGKGVEIHARSVFLQGLLLMRPETLPTYFADVKELLAEYHTYINGLGLSPVKAALSFVDNCPEIDHFVLGVTSQAELKEILDGLAELPHPGPDFTRFACGDENIVNPARWRLS